jgi:hypothetical protein
MMLAMLVQLSRTYDNHQLNVETNGRGSNSSTTAIDQGEYETGQLSEAFCFDVDGWFLCEDY